MKGFLSLILLCSTLTVMAQSEKTGKAKEFSSKFGATIGMSRLCTQPELEQLAKAAFEDAIKICRNSGWTFCHKRNSLVVKNVPKYNVFDGTSCEVKAFVDGVFYKPI